jgi:hypothetical protein
MKGSSVMDRVGSTRWRMKPRLGKARIGSGAERMTGFGEVKSREALAVLVYDLWKQNWTVVAVSECKEGAVENEAGWVNRKAVGT